jgi:hypothetical protein
MRCTGMALRQSTLVSLLRERAGGAEGPAEPRKSNVPVSGNVAESRASAAGLAAARALGKWRLRSGLFMSLRSDLFVCVAFWARGRWTCGSPNGLVEAQNCISAYVRKADRGRGLQVEFLRFFRT